jgi:hypothetical protein
VEAAGDEGQGAEEEEGEEVRQNGPLQRHHQPRHTERDSHHTQKGGQQRRPTQPQGTTKDQRRAGAQKREGGREGT